VSVSLDALPVATAVKGTLVTFTALGVSNPVGAAFEYQFLVNGAIVQNYSATATYSFPLTQAVGTYTVAVNARTSVASAVVTNSLVYTITPAPATGVQLLPNLPSPQLASKNIKFTATGIGSTGYQYQFSVDGVVVQAYSTLNTYTLPLNTFAGLHLISVDVSTSAVPVTADATASINYTISNPIPATGVTITPNLPSPQNPGTAVIFTAAGQGSSGYQYRFQLRLVGGPAATVVQDWSTANTWTLPNTTPFGTWRVTADVRTFVGAAQATASVDFVLTNPPATGVTLAPSLPSPQIPGTAVIFTAQGQGSAGYQYRFRLMINGANAVTVQNWSTTATYALPISLVPVTYRVYVDVRTASTGGANATTSVNYNIVAPKATGVTLTPALPSPQVFGTPVLFTAQGVGSSTGFYQYRFQLRLNNGGNAVVVQNWSTTNTWTMPGTTAAGLYTVTVEVRTATSGNRDAITSVQYTVNP